MDFLGQKKKGTSSSEHEDLVGYSPRGRLAGWRRRGKISRKHLPF